MYSREMFTDIGTGSIPLSIHSRIFLHALSQIIWSSFSINPFSSNTGTKSAGDIMPFSGWIHLASASAPIIRLVEMLNFGWRYITN